MKHLALVLLAAFALPAFADTPVILRVEGITESSTIKSTKSNASERSDGVKDHGANVDRAVVKSKSNITNNRTKSDNFRDGSDKAKVDPNDGSLDRAIKGSKSNSSERIKQGGQTENVAPIRSTKSNASERSTTINSTKSNTFRFEEGGKNDGKSAPVGNSQQKYGIAVDDPGVPNDKPAPKK
jgi:hypothetical protein